MKSNQITFLKLEKKPKETNKKKKSVFKLKISYKQNNK